MQAFCNEWLHWSLVMADSFERSRCCEDFKLRVARIYTDRRIVQHSDYWFSCKADDSWMWNTYHSKSCNFFFPLQVSIYAASSSWMIHFWFLSWSWLLWLCSLNYLPQVFHLPMREVCSFSPVHLFSIRQEITPALPWFPTFWGCMDHHLFL